MIDPNLLQAYRARLPQGRRASDAQSIDDDVYSSTQDPEVEEDPRGLVDRLYRDNQRGQPIRGPIINSVPTTKNRYA